MANIIYIPAKTISHSSSKRVLLNVKYIVIHGTGNENDTAVSNGNYFAKINTRSAGAHLFIDQTGNIVQSVKLEYAAWAVGGAKYSDCNKTGGGKYYGQCTNANSVSIELCDIVNKEVSSAMIASIQQVIKIIKQSCPNANTIIRHFDVNGKHCPSYYMDNNKWESLLSKITSEKETPQTVDLYKVRITATSLNIRKGPGVKYGVVGSIKDKGIYTIVEEEDGWGLLKSYSKNRNGWISLRYTEKV